jgi:DedD protein
MQALWEENLEASDVAEVHWSTGTILAVFFAASLISAVFFGLGYSFGRGGTARPGVGIAASLPATAENPANHLSAPASDWHSHAAANAIAAPAAHRDTQAPRMQASQAAVPPAKTNKSAVIATRVNSSAAEKASSAHYMVQVGAIGDHKDARRLLSKLRKSGFHAGIYTSKHDKFLHVQIGPFATTEQAQKVRHHVIASGYRAILKHAS